MAYTSLFGGSSKLAAGKPFPWPLNRTSCAADGREPPRLLRRHGPPGHAAAVYNRIAITVHHAGAALLPRAMSTSVVPPPLWTWTKINVASPHLYDRSAHFRCAAAATSSSGAASVPFVGAAHLAHAASIAFGRGA